MQIHSVPIFSDNLSYIIVDEKSGKTATIDPASPADVISYCNRHNLSIPELILTTHRHADHSAGNVYFSENYRDSIIVGGANEHVPYCNHEVKDGEQVLLGSIPIHVISSPCHTTGHVMFYINHDNQRYLFTGDTFFIAGCGRFFEGDARDMLSNIQKMIALPHDTKMYCGHEYTLASLRFAQHVEPDNTAITKKMQWAQQCRDEGKNTVPSTIGEETTYNPFLRIEHPSVISFTGTSGDPVETLQKLRHLKDIFT